MSGLRSALVLTVLMSVLVGGRVEQSLPAPAKAAEASALCNLSFMPSDIQNRLKANFGSWKIQEPESLSDHARKT